jgi:hypothetical protein
MTGSASERSRSPSTSPAPRRTHSPSGKALASRQGEARQNHPGVVSRTAFARDEYLGGQSPASLRAESVHRLPKSSVVPLRDRLSRRLSNHDRSRAEHPGGHQSVRDYERASSWNQPGTYPTAPRGEAESRPNVLICTPGGDGIRPPRLPNNRSDFLLEQWGRPNGDRRWRRAIYRRMHRYSAAQRPLFRSAWPATDCHRPGGRTGPSSSPPRRAAV